MNRASLLLATLLASAGPFARAQGGCVSSPAVIEAGSPFAIHCTGTEKAVLRIVGPAGALRREVPSGSDISLPAGSLKNAGHYQVILTSGSSTATGSLDVIAAQKPAELSFLANPSRLPVGVHNGISGTVYLFDLYGNLVTAPVPVQFQLSNPSSPAQQRTVTALDGSASVEMDSPARVGSGRFVARAGDVASTRVVEETPGDPCTLRVSAESVGQELALTTGRILDCSGNPVPDGTIVTFTETYDGMQSAADVPVKESVAEVRMPAHRGAKISVASGVVMGNEIRWER